MTTTIPAMLPLESGDHLTRDEFHRRYLAHPEIKKAELIEGVVYVSSPVGPLHSTPHASFVGWLYLYSSWTPGIQLADTGSLRMGENVEVQPDAMLFRPFPIGRVRPIGNSYFEGVPELVAEISATSASYDLHSKLRAYERNGVEEYIVWRTLEARIDWFRLRDGAYVPLQPDARGVIESEVFPGLRLPVAAMISGDNAEVVAALQQPKRTRRRRATLGRADG